MIMGNVNFLRYSLFPLKYVSILKYIERLGIKSNCTSIK